MAFIKENVNPVIRVLAAAIQDGNSDDYTIDAAAIVTGGSGYSVNDKLTVQGGTFTTACILNVDSVNAGVIDGISVDNAGAYTVLPTDPVSVTGGTGNDDATFNLSGAAFAVNDQLTVIGGTFESPAILNVDSIDDDGNITGISVFDRGNYTAVPSNPVSVTPSGNGSGVTFNLTSDTEKGYLLASKMLLDAATNGHVIALNLVNGGSGWSANDEFTINDGNALYGNGAVGRIISETGGVATEIQLISAGIYDVLPDASNTALATTGNGTGLTVTVDVEGPYEALPDGTQSGTYAVGEVVTVDEGSLHAGSSHHQFVVTAVDGSNHVTELKPLRIGRYDVAPVNPVAITGGGGSGLQLTLNKVGHIIPDPTAETFVDGFTDFQWMTQGTNLAGQDPICGVKTFNPSGNPQWGLKVATSYDNTKTFELQPGASLGDTSSPSTIGTPRIPSSASALTMFMSITGRRIVFVSRTAPAYEMGYLGLFTPFIDSPSTKYPSPLICAGTCYSQSTDINDVFDNGFGEPHASVLHNGNALGTGLGAYQIRRPTGEWQELGNDGDAQFKLWPYNIDPVNVVEAPDLEDGVGTETVRNLQISIGEEMTSSSSLNLVTRTNEVAPSPFGPNGRDLHLPVTCTVYQDQPGALQVYGELEDVFLINGNGLNAEDETIDSNGNAYTVFTDTVTSANNHFFAIRMV